MNVKQLGALFVGAVLMALAGSAGAGTLYNGTAAGAGGTVGSYNVMIYEDSIFSFHINSVASNANPPSTGDVTQVRVTFCTGLDGNGQKIPSITTLMGGTNAGVWNNWGIAIAGNRNQMYIGLNSTAIQGDGSNQFQQQAGGYFNLVNGNVHSVQVLLQEGGSNNVWIDTFNISDFSVPETSSFALLLPGLVPLGIALRRRVARP